MKCISIIFLINTLITNIMQFDIVTSANNITAFNKRFDDEYWKGRRKGLTLNDDSFNFEAVSYKEARISWRKEAAKKRRIPIRNRNIIVTK